MKLKDIEAARILELNDIKEKNVPQSNPEQSTPETRSDLPKQ